MNRAYSLLEIKSVDAEQRVLTGIASTPSTDRVGDIVEPTGATFKLPLPLLWQHDSRQPIGEVFSAKVTAAGIEIKARIAKIDEPGTLKDRLDEAWQSIKSGLVKGFSIGFKSLEDADIKGTYGIRFIKWLWLELSAVTIPANADCTIQTIKQFDAGVAETGRDSVIERSTQRSGVSDTTRSAKPLRMDRSMKKSYQEQIAGWEATRKAKTDRLDEIVSKGADTGEAMDDAEQTEHDELEGEVARIDKQILALRSAEDRAKSTAKAVDGSAPDKAAESRNPRIITMKESLPPGIRFARMAMCLAASKGVRSDALALAEQFYPNDNGIREILKTAVAGGTTANGQAPLLQYTDILTEFIDYLRPLTILGKFGMPIPGGFGNYPDLTRVPFNVRVGTQTAGGSGSWVGEGKPIPLTKGTFSTATLDFAKVAAISVLTKEEIRFAAISSETKVRNDLARALVQKIDADFVDPTNAGTSGVKPASITNNIAATSVSGTTYTAAAVDLKNMIGSMLASNLQAASLALIMSQRTALSLSLIRTTLGIKIFPDITMNGGMLEGIPVIVSEAVYGIGSPSTNMIIAVNANDVFLADDGVVNIEVSDQASLEMLDGSLVQDGTAGTGTSLVSLWQTQMVGIKATREINWKLMRAASVQYLSGVAYVPQ